MKIAVYTITKNEEQFIQRWADSCKEADYRLIVDTGSTDGTVDAAIAAGCEVGFIMISPWRFDDARNAALAMVPNDIDYCIALDADEILIPGWRQEMEKVSPEVTRPRYKYVWNWNANGSEGLTYGGDKIHARKNYRWKHPVHEVIICTGTEIQGWTGLQIHHHPDNTKSRSQYLPLLELAVKESPNDDRNLFYLGRELMFNGRNDEAAVHLRRHLDLSTWPAERATCMRYLGRVTGNREHWFLKACGEAPDRREPWIELARFYYETQRWPQLFAAAMRALEIKEKPLEYLCEADAWGSLPHDLASIAAWNLGLREIARSEADKALELEPRDPRLRGNAKVIYGLSSFSHFDVVIPTKSNVDGLRAIMDILRGSSGIGKIIIVGDGDAGLRTAEEFATEPRIEILSVPKGAGIHAMWNTAMTSITPGNHCAFINDDITLDPGTLSILSAQLDGRKDIGLICPNYDGRFIPSSFIETNQTCGGRYDGSGGLAGFCMMLAADLVSEWRFDERMLWWYGDDDILKWTSLVKSRKVGISGLAICSDNKSWTIENDPPENFNEIVENDRIIFSAKWGLS